MERYTEEKLNKMSVHTLRVILRSEFNGVPGVSNKGELISQILDIQSGASAPARSTKGRKPLGEFITPISEELTFSDAESDEDTIKRGVFEQNADGYGFVRVNKGLGFVDYFVPKTIAKKYSLSTGDEIECSVYYASEVGALNVKSILAVNGKLPQEGDKKEDFSLLRAKYPSEKISFTKGNSPIVDAVDLFCPIGKGQRCLVEDVDGKFGTSFANRILNNVNDENITILSLFAGVKPEEVEDAFQNKNRQNVVLPITFSAEETLRIVNLTVERAKTLCQMGKDVLLVLDSLSYIANVYGEYSASEKSSGYVKLGLTPSKFVNEIFGVGGNFGEGKSITVIATVDAKREDRSLGELVSIATSVVKLEGNDIISRRGYVVDLLNSYTIKDEMLLTKEQICYVDGEREKLNENKGYLAKIYSDLK